MVIQCSHCQARFKLADDKIKPEGTKVRCAKCKEVFTVFGETEKPAEEIKQPVPAIAEPPRPASEQTEDEEFSFDISDITSPTPTATAVTTVATTDDGQGFSLDVPAFESSNPPSPPAETLSPSAFGFDSVEADTDAFTLDVGGTPSPAPPSTEIDTQTIDFSAPDISFETPAFESATPAQTTSLPESTPEGFSFDDADLPPEISFQTPDLPAATGTGTEYGEFSFEENSAPPAFETTTANDTFEQTASGDLDFSFDVPLQSSQTNADPTASHGDIDLSNFSFGDEGSESPSQPTPSFDSFDTGDDPFATATEGNTTPPPAPPVQAPVAAVVTPQAPPAIEPASEPPVKRPPPAPVVREPVHLSRATTKKKGIDIGSIIKFVVVILLLVGAGFAYLNHAKLEEGFRGLVNLYLEKQAPAEVQGEIEVKNLTYTVVANAVEGELVVIRGEAINNYPVMRSSIQVKAILFGNNGTILKEQTAYCGNILNDATLAKSTIGKIQDSMENELGDSLTNMNIAPGKAVPFTIVFKGGAKELVEFAVDVVSSKPGG